MGTPPFRLTNGSTGEPFEFPELTPESFRATIDRDGILVAVFELWLRGIHDGSEVRRLLVEAGIDLVDAEHALLQLAEQNPDEA